jgi:hypothetical protein
VAHFTFSLPLITSKPIPGRDRKEAPLGQFGDPDEHAHPVVNVRVSHAFFASYASRDVSVSTGAIALRWLTGVPTALNTPAPSHGSLFTNNAREEKQAEASGYAETGVESAYAAECPGPKRGDQPSERNGRKDNGNAGFPVRRSEGFERSYDQPINEWRRRP